MIIANGLEGGFGHAQPVDAALQHIFDGLQLLLLHPLDGTRGKHLQGELAASPEVQTQTQSVGGQKGSGGDGQSQDEGKPALGTCHLRSGPT